LNDLVRKVADMAGLEIELEHDLSKQEGRRVKEADLTRLAAKVPAFRQTVSLEDGLADMLDWYAGNLASGTFSK
jgi:nucleoside-diphosphate-sugar epimerase